jgi:sugar lactone lactonase YvrE
LLEGGSFFESPRWHEGKWWVSDFYRRLVLSVRPDGDEKEVLTVEGQPSGIGWLPDGSMLIVSMKDHRLIRLRPDGSVAIHADLTDLCGGHLNDLVVDERGRCYVGNFGFDLLSGGDPARAPIILVDPDGRTTVAADDLMFPNGSVITPDGKTLIVGETMGCRYTAFTIADDGSLTERWYGRSWPPPRRWARWPRRSLR